jgi:GDP-4-dehydro-6-deoxy-D-mannose reductase
VVGWGRRSPRPDFFGLADWAVVDLLDRRRVLAAIEDLRPRLVYHLAGASQVAESWRDTATPLEGNVLATAHLLDAICRAGLDCRVLVTGSAAVYAPSDLPIPEGGRRAPAGPYAISKLAQEQLARRAFEDDGIKVIVTRSFNHTGPGQRPDFFAPSVARQIALIERGELDPVIRVGNLDATRDFTDVRDVVSAYVALMEAGTPGEVYNVGSGTARSMRSVLEALVSRARLPVTIEIDPSRLRPNDAPSLLADTGRLRAATGWTPLIGFDQMLDDLLAYWRRVRT